MPTRLGNSTTHSLPIPLSPTQTVKLKSSFPRPFPFLHSFHRVILLCCAIRVGALAPAYYPRGPQYGTVVIKGSMGGAGSWLEGSMILLWRWRFTERKKPSLLTRFGDPQLFTVKARIHARFDSQNFVLLGLLRYDLPIPQATGRENKTIFYGSQAHTLAHATKLARLEATDNRNVSCQSTTTCICCIF